MALRGEPTREAMSEYDNLPIKVERWSKGCGRAGGTIAMAADSLSAKAAFEVAVERRPGASILLRQRARVIRKSLED